MKNVKSAALCLAALLLISTFAGAQGRTPAKKPAAKERPIIFAVLNDGKTIEPIAVIDKGSLLSPTDDASLTAKVFQSEFYRTGAKYKLIFGGAEGGTITVKSSDPTAECSAYMAAVVTDSPQKKLGGRVMALATNQTGSATAKFMRRMPTSAERAEAETLVRAELSKRNIDAKTLDYHNLTAIDRDHDGKAEMVGSYWVSPTQKSRKLLFFIAEIGADGKYEIGISSFQEFDEADMMGGGEISMIDDGVYHELFLDSFEFDGDESNEIFTYTRTLEGAGLKVYGKYDGKWEVAFENSNYHCAF